VKFDIFTIASSSNGSSSISISIEHFFFSSHFVRLFSEHFVLFLCCDTLVDLEIVFAIKACKNSD